MNSNEEILKLLPLKNQQLKIQALLKAKEILMSDKYKKYDEEFKINFANGFVENYMEQINEERKRVAGEMLLNNENKRYIMEKTGLSLDEILKVTIPTNSSEILRIYEEMKKNSSNV